MVLVLLVFLVKITSKGLVDNSMFEGLNVKKSNIFGSNWFINSTTSTIKLCLTLSCLKLHNMKVKDLMFSSRL